MNTNMTGYIDSFYRCVPCTKAARFSDSIESVNRVMAVGDSNERTDFLCNNQPVAAAAATPIKLTSGILNNT